MGSDSSSDTIPRTSIQQIVAGLRHVADSGGRSTYEATRLRLLGAGNRKAPATRTALWTVARDVLGELARLKLATVGMLPRKLSDVERLRDSPCELTAAGTNLAVLAAERAGEAYDALLSLWLQEHLYFRLLMRRLLQGPMHVPDVTNLTQLGASPKGPRDFDSMGANCAENCAARLEGVGWATERLLKFKTEIGRRFLEQRRAITSPDLDPKRLIDLVQDKVLIPSFLDAESLPFDPVSFYQMLRCAQDFFAATWTASHPRFVGRVVIATCDFDAPIADARPARPVKAIHHGVSYASPLFAAALKDAYNEAAGGGGGYASAYAVRSLVCTSIRAPLPVFSRCLEAVITAGASSGITVYTELPFEPPPQGEDYVEVARRRIGRLKVI